MTNDQAPENVQIPNTNRTTKNLPRFHWFLNIGPSLVIGHWSLGILRGVRSKLPARCRQHVGQRAAGVSPEETNASWMCEFPTARESPNPKHQSDYEKPSALSLVLEHWAFSGHWTLVIGHSSRRPFQTAGKMPAARWAACCWRLAGRNECKLDVRIPNRQRKSKSQTPIGLRKTFRAFIGS